MRDGEERAIAWRWRCVAASRRWCPSGAAAATTCTSAWASRRSGYPGRHRLRGALGLRRHRLGLESQRRASARGSTRRDPDLLPSAVQGRSAHHLRAKGELSLKGFARPSPLQRPGTQDRIGSRATLQARIDAMPRHPESGSPGSVRCCASPALPCPSRRSALRTVQRLIDEHGGDHCASTRRRPGRSAGARPSSRICVVEVNGRSPHPRRRASPSPFSSTAM